MTGRFAADEDGFATLLGAFVIAAIVAVAAGVCYLGAATVATTAPSRAPTWPRWRQQPSMSPAATAARRQRHSPRQDPPATVADCRITDPDVSVTVEVPVHLGAGRTAHGVGDGAPDRPERGEHNGTAPAPSCRKCGRRTRSVLRLLGRFLSRQCRQLAFDGGRVCVGVGAKPRGSHRPVITKMKGMNRIGDQANPPPPLPLVRAVLLGLLHVGGVLTQVGQVLGRHGVRWTAAATRAAADAGSVARPALMS